MYFDMVLEYFLGFVLRAFISANNSLLSVGLSHLWVKFTNPVWIVYSIFEWDKFFFAYLASTPGPWGTMSCLLGFLQLSNLSN